MKGVYTIEELIKMKGVGRFEKKLTAQQEEELFNKQWESIKIK